MPQLPPHPNLEQLRHQARDLLRAAVADDPAAVARIRAVSPRTALAAAQLAIARECGFPSWTAMKVAVESRSGPGVAPLMPGKHARPSITRSADFLDWAQSRGWNAGPPPCGVILTAESFVTSHLEANPDRYRLSTTITPTNGRVFMTADPPVAIACLGPGATAVVTLVEHLIQLGVRLFVTAGPAPAISTVLRPGDCLVVDRALRDDGVSQHYLAPDRYVEADEALAARLVGAAAARGFAPIRGATWTVPTPYRTTEEEIEAYRAEGVLATEMSTAALFAVASALGARAVSILMISRVLGPPGPPPRRDHDGRFFIALDAAVAAIRSEAEPADEREVGQ
ncbi:MAG: hypothetical protein LC808_04415 [Actinobacteria bacterium]|nr:hypothetical protein [Actinomycetota bacterium]